MNDAQVDALFDLLKEIRDILLRHDLLESKEDK